MIMLELHLRLNIYQLLWRGFQKDLAMALDQVKAGNNSEGLLNKIREIVHCQFICQNKLQKKYTAP